jgi:site-specific DNA recombinase
MSAIAEAAVGTKRAAIYCRVSTTGQREDGTSLDTQLEACRDHGAGLGYAVPPDFLFSEDWPGTTLDRPRLDEVRRLAQERAISAVICYATDRLSRDPIQLAILAQELEQRGCKLELVTEPLDGSPEGQLLQFVRGWAGKLEHAKIVERTSRGRREAARRGRLPTGSTLYGYRYLKGEGRCEIDPDGGEVVRTIYRWYTEEGLTQGRIAIRLTDLGIRPPTHGGKGGATWHVSTVKRILSNPSYAGRAEAFKWVRVPPIKGDPDRRRRYANSRREPRPVEQRIPIPGAFPPIVEPEVWDAAREMRARNRDASPRNRKRDYLLAGHVVCAWCRRRYGASTTRRWTYYYCPGAKGAARAERCRNNRLAAPRVELDVWARVAVALADPTLITREVERQRAATETATGARRDIELVEAQLERLNGQERRLLKLFRFGEIDEDLIVAENAELRRERERLSAERSGLVARLERAERDVRQLESVAAYCEQVRRRLKSFDYAGRRLALEALGVTVTADGGAWRVEAAPPTRELAAALQPSGSWPAPGARCRLRPRPGPRPGRRPRR